ncbi:deoxyribonuclease IV [Candidatus Gottesmanbacteria bacterium]|nr:deoxyribonuclease IV [Candidatus Gottesmanbacteria bacterium]
MKRRIGAHVSISKGLRESLPKALRIGANCMQIFSSPPQSFTPPHFTDEECESFRKLALEVDIQPVFIHALYLANLSSDDEGLRVKSVKSLIADMIFCEKIGGAGVIVHTGSHKGRGFEVSLVETKKSLSEILAATPETSNLYLEIACGNAGKVGQNFQELKKLLEIGNSPRLRICLDTAHMFANGYAFDTQEKVDRLVQEIETNVGWHNVSCVHVNDSKVNCGGLRDQHENIGSGYIGRDAFRMLLNHERLKTLPLIIETPGFDDQGPDKQNLDILKSILEG